MATPTIHVQRVQGFVMAKPFIFGHPMESKTPRHQDPPITPLVDYPPAQLTLASFFTLQKSVVEDLVFCDFFRPKVVAIFGPY